MTWKPPSRWRMAVWVLLLASFLTSASLGFWAGGRVRGGDPPVVAWIVLGTLCAGVLTLMVIRVFRTDKQGKFDEPEWEALRLKQVARRHEKLERYPLPAPSDRAGE